MCDYKTGTKHYQRLSMNDGKWKFKFVTTDLSYKAHGEREKRETERDIFAFINKWNFYVCATMTLKYLI